MTNIIIRKETKEDYYNTELMTMRAFWNVYGPGCNEHYLVHILRESKDYLPELSLVAEADGEIVGTIMYSRAKVTGEEAVYEVAAFGPLCVDPVYCNSGVGERLLKESIELAKKAGFAGIIIFGEPEYYPKFGFETCDKYGITTADGKNFDAFMCLPLNDSFKEIHGKFSESADFEKCGDEEAVADFTKQFPYMKPLKYPCQPVHEKRLGRVASVRKNSFTISFFGREIDARLKGAFKANYAEELPIVGDYVTFKFNPCGESMISELCERTSVLKRPDQAKTATNQYMVANADIAFIVTSLNEDYSYNRIARYASVCLEGGVTPIVILTKADLCEDTWNYRVEAETVAPGIKVHVVSALEGEGLEELREYLKPGVTIVLLGSSGAGKSTLINALAGREVMKTGEIRDDDGEGRHTTTHRQLIDFGDGVTVIDTPGMREIGVTDSGAGIEETFADILELESQCRFSDCRHDTEPGCAIKAALADGRLTPERLELFRSFNAENTRNYAKKKMISQWHKAYKKNSDLFGGKFR